jgi:hypothetical protein
MLAIVGRRRARVVDRQSHPRLLQSARASTLLVGPETTEMDEVGQSAAETP